MQNNFQHLNLEKRYTTYRLLKLGKKQNEIAKAIGVSEGTVSREISRNKGKRGYRPQQVHKFAMERKAKQRRPKKIVGELATEVEERLIKHHSPEQISQTLKKEGVDAPSHE